MAAAAELRPLQERPAEARGLNLASEFDLLLACCCQSAQTRQARIQQLIARQHDWNNFLSLAERHRVIPHAYRSLTPHADQLPARDFAQLRLKYEENARSALWLTGELVRVLRHLAACGIQAMPYKGPVLAQTLYGAVTARQFSDLDILVRPEEVTAATAALAGLGYRAAIQLAGRAERDYLASGYECAFDHPSAPHLLELKWRILPRFYAVDFDIAGLFERADTVSLCGISIPTLCADDLLLVLCVHAAKHLWSQLSWLCDVAELIRSSQIDWDASWRQARQLGIQRIVALSLLLSRDLLGSALPLPAQRWLEEDRATGSLKNELSEVILHNASCDTESVAYFKKMMRLRERWRDKFRFLWRLLLTPGPSEWSAIALPDPLFPLYRMVRLARLAARLTVK
jgi:hypothetical protein